jgi:hypothetical protein
MPQRKSVGDKGTHDPISAVDPVVVVITCAEESCPRRVPTGVGSGEPVRLDCAGRATTCKHFQPTRLSLSKDSRQAETGVDMKINAVVSILFC